MSDQNPYEPTRRMDAGQGGDPGRERTQRLPTDASGQADRQAYTPPSEPISYTEEYGSEPGAYERTTVDRRPGDPAERGGPSSDTPGAKARRTFTTTTLILTSVAALLIGGILTLLLLPEEDPQVILDEQAAQQALTEAQQINAEQAARITDLESQIAERDAQIAQLQAQQADDQSAADQALAEREAALSEREAAQNEREASLEAREQAVAQREADVAAREQAVVEGAPEAEGGFELPDVGELEVPAELPEIDEEAARGVIERFVDRLQSLFGSGDG